jgi:flavodoxin
MTRYLLAYYSWSGNTAKVAKAIAETLSADLDEIRDMKPRRGFFAFFGSAFEASRQKPAAIAPSTKDPAAYDVVILGTPVWAGNMASPLRAYIMREKPKIKEIALFCTLHGSGGEKTLASMAQLCGSTAIADLQVQRPALQSDAWRDAAHDFARRIREKETPAPPMAAS